MSNFPANEAKFEAFRSLNLPLGQYAITSSGPMGIRDMRAISDVDIVVTDELWDQLATVNEPHIDNGVTIMRLVGGEVEVLGSGSIMRGGDSGPSVAEQIATAELIDGLAFVRLEAVIFFKHKLGRPKDLADIELIERYRASN